MRLERMNSPEVEAYFKDHKIALLSVGSIECHGLHNALGTDTLIPMKLLELVEQKSDVLILPGLPLFCHSERSRWQHACFGKGMRLS